jgi:hypothetical protein
MPIQPLHRRVARVALRAARRYGVALAGGNALQVHGLVDRYTEDVDLFTDQEGTFRDAAAAVETALRAAGFTPEPLEAADGLADVWDGMDGLAEWRVADSGETMAVQLAFFERLRAPVQVRNLGPVLSLEDIVAGKAAALASRAYVRDFVDMAQILGTFTVDQVIGFARQLDPGLEDADFADAGLRLDQMDDLAFARYGLGAGDVARLREQFAAWPRTAPPRSR